MMPTSSKPHEGLSPSQTQGRIELIYLTYGEPADASFSVQYSYSLAILKRLTLKVAPIPYFVLPLIAAYRGWIRSRTFKARGFRSPLEEHSQRQRDALERLLRARLTDCEISVHLVYEFREPFLGERLKAMANPPEEFVLLPSYIAESDFTSGVSRTDLAAFHRETNGLHGWPEPRYISNLGSDPRLADIMADHILSFCEKEGQATEECILVLGAHGTVIEPPPGILNGLKDTATLADAIQNRMASHFREIRVGYLNHYLGGDWTQPSMDELAHDLRKSAAKIVYFPFGFTTDNAESLLEGPDALGNQASLLTVPGLNDSPAFVEYLAHRVEVALQEAPEPWTAMAKEPPPEPEPLVGEPGFLKAKAPTLTILAALFWIAVGVKLLLRGTPPFTQLTGLTEHTAVIALALLIAYFKGYRMLGAMAKKNIIRLRRLPQPSPLYRVFPLRTYILILFFGFVGMGIKLLLSSAFAKAWILLGVGGALFMGGFVYLLNHGLSRPLPQKQGKGEQNSHLGSADLGHPSHHHSSPEASS